MSINFFVYAGPCIRVPSYYPRKDLEAFVTACEGRFKLAPEEKREGVHWLIPEDTSFLEREAEFDRHGNVDPTLVSNTSLEIFAMVKAFRSDLDLPEMLALCHTCEWAIIPYFY